MRSNSRLIALLALSLAAAACGDDEKPKDHGTVTPGDGDGDGTGGLDGGGQPNTGDGDTGPAAGDGDGDGNGHGDGGDRDIDGGDKDADVDPWKGVPDAGPDGEVLSQNEKLALAIEEKLRLCKVVGGPGEYNQGTVDDKYDICIAECILNNDCDALFDNFCVGKAGNPFAGCLQNCVLPDDGFLCSNGSRIPHLSVCDDGATDSKCPNGEDEAASLCASQKFTCKDGDKISNKFVCDLVVIAGKKSVGGCKDGSDEDQNCAIACPDYKPSN